MLVCFQIFLKKPVILTNVATVLPAPPRVFALRAAKHVLQQVQNRHGSLPMKATSPASRLECAYLRIKKAAAQQTCTAATDIIGL